MSWLMSFRMCQCMALTVAMALGTSVFVCVSALAGGDAVSVVVEDSIRDGSFAAMHTLHSATLRTLAATAATNWLVGEKLRPDVSDAWSSMLEDGMTVCDGDAELGTVALPPILVEDFFSGAVVMLGPCDAHGAVFAYANPFWDAFLFVRTGDGDLPVPDGGCDGGDGDVSSGASYPLRRVPKVQEAVWIDGATLRDGPVPGASVAEPHAVVLWRVAAANSGRFESLCPGRRGDPVRLPRAVRDCDRAAVAAAMRERAGRRAAQLGELARDPVLLRAAALSLGLLRDGTAAQLARFFDSPDHAFFAESMAALPTALRASFSPAGARKSADGDAQLIFVARDAPRVFATVSFSAGRLAGTSREPVQMEWYDLSRADDLLRAWSDNGKGGGQ